MIYMGVDLGVHKLSCAVLDAGAEEPIALAVQSFIADPEEPRDLQLSVLGHFAHDMALNFAVDSVWVESIIVGNNRKYSLQLAEVKGAVLASLARRRMQNGTDTRIVDNMVWKHDVIGKGNASKDEVKNHINETHPSYSLLCGEQDEFDAVAIALYGLRITTAAGQLDLQSG